MRVYKKIYTNSIEYYVVHNLGEHFWWWSSICWNDNSWGSGGSGLSWNISADTWDIGCATSEKLIEVSPLEVLLVTGLEVKKYSPPCPNYECRCQQHFVREV